MDDEIERCAARHIWRRRTKLTPTGVTWEAWYAKKFGRTLDQAARYFKKLRGDQE